jgi:soluble lytic murein transglycosylase-like protein
VSVASWDSDDVLEAVVESICAHPFLRVIVIIVALAVLVLALCAPVMAEVPRAAAAHKREYLRITRAEWGLEAPTATLAGQIHQESAWNCSAISRVGARGCAQFMPTTATWIGTLDRRLADGDLTSPGWAFRAQAVYMKWLHDRLKGPAPCEQMAFALAAYNGGLGWVQKRRRASPVPACCIRATCRLNPGIAPPNQRENEEYPIRINRHAASYALDGWGLTACQ